MVKYGAEQTRWYGARPSHRGNCRHVIDSCKEGRKQEVFKWSSKTGVKWSSQLCNEEDAHLRTETHNRLISNTSQLKSDKRAERRRRCSTGYYPRFSSRLRRHMVRSSRCHSGLGTGGFTTEGMGGAFVDVSLPGKDLEASHGSELVASPGVVKSPSSAGENSHRWSWHPTGGAARG